MNIIKKYIEYLKDNPKGYWFKSRLFGWGWVPVRWQGWMVILAFIVYLIIVATIFLPYNRPFEYSFLLIVGILLLLYVCFKKGEKPRWSWGFRK